MIYNLLSDYKQIENQLYIIKKENVYDLKQQ